MGISPNSITWASLAFAGAGAVAFAQGHFGLGALLSLMGTLCDCFDGMVARAMGTASDAGEVLDAAIDRASDFLFLAGVAYFYKDRPAFFACAMLALLGSFLVSYATAKAEALQIDVPGGQMRRPERATYLLLGAAMMPISMTYIEPRFFGTVVGLPMALVVGFVGLVSISSSMRRFAAMIDALHARDARRSSMSSVVNEDSGEHLIPSQTAEVAE
jgi:phosphatidylglycerophosphate synthase